MNKKIVPIFASGGTRLPAHVGILKALKELEFSFNSVVGISGGSIVAAMYANGLSLDEMFNIVTKTDFKQFKQYSLYRLFRHGGLSSGLQFENWMDEIMDQKTFGDLDVNLNVIATDLYSGAPVVFNKKTAAEMKVAKAVHYSMSIPLIYCSTEYRDKLLVDGGILSEDALFKDWQGDGTRNICFRLKSEHNDKPIESNKGFRLSKHITMLIRIFMTALSREYVDPNYWHHTIVVNTGNTSPIDFDMTIEQKKKLHDLGYQTVKDFLPVKLKKSEESKNENF